LLYIIWTRLLSPLQMYFLLVGMEGWSYYYVYPCYHLWPAIQFQITTLFQVSIHLFVLYIYLDYPNLLVYMFGLSQSTGICLDYPNLLVYMFGLSQSTGICLDYPNLLVYMFELSESTGIYAWIIPIYWYIYVWIIPIYWYICLDYPNLLVYMFGLSQSTGIYVLQTATRPQS